MSKPIYVTQPYLPPLAELILHLEQIWESRILTNGGPFHQALEQALAEFLNVPHVSLFNNATIGLIAALQALELRGEVITTPYSFVATANALVWNGLKPVFVDIDPATMNIDADQIEASITEETSAIMPVHCYGRPCDVERIQAIANKHGLKVIYDSAHAFGVIKLGESLHRYGDLSVLSMHATKVFNTFEGGLVASHDVGMKLKIDQLKNFGYVNETTVVLAGINGKMNEFSAALGMAQLPHLSEAIEMRADIDRRYREALADEPGIQFLPHGEGYEPNYSYFPILVKPDYAEPRDSLYSRLKENQIFPRRYFYPLISEFPMYRDLESARPGNLPHASAIASQVLCLPIYPGLAVEDQDRIIRLIRR